MKASLSMLFFPIFYQLGYPHCAPDCEYQADSVRTCNHLETIKHKKKDKKKIKSAIYACLCIFVSMYQLTVACVQTIYRDKNNLKHTCDKNCISGGMCNCAYNHIKRQPTRNTRELDESVLLHFPVYFP